jgi:hypothetical protein
MMHTNLSKEILSFAGRLKGCELNITFFFGLVPMETTQASVGKKKSILKYPAKYAIQQID